MRRSEKKHSRSYGIYSCYIIVYSTLTKKLSTKISITLFKKVVHNRIFLILVSWFWRIFKYYFSMRFIRQFGVDYYETRVKKKTITAILFRLYPKKQKFEKIKSFDSSLIQVFEITNEKALNKGFLKKFLFTFLYFHVPMCGGRYTIQV